jgi:hypothetical protein
MRAGAGRDADDEGADQTEDERRGAIPSPVSATWTLAGAGSVRLEAAYCAAVTSRGCESPEADAGSVCFEAAYCAAVTSSGSGSP